MKVRRSGSPTLATRRPSASTTVMDPKCVDSIEEPRVNATSCAGPMMPPGAPGGRLALASNGRKSPETCAASHI
jgi:hypothetical protein